MHIGTKRGVAAAALTFMLAAAAMPLSTFADSTYAMSSANGYYPWAQPSAWYILPGQNLSFSGGGFEPGETVSVSGSGAAGSAVAGGSGAVSISNIITVPYTWQNTWHSFTLRGNTSGASVALSVLTGTFYPQVSPSSYWVLYGQTMSARASGFAPGEQVQFLVNGAAAGQSTADSSGAASASFSAPTSGASFTLAARGLSTGLSNARTVYLHP